jgi:Sulfate permease and related transporters (MFS superfamily)
VIGKYSWSAFRGDLGGGFLAALIALPYGLAMASLMGLPPMLGLFTSILTAPITALFGRNPVLIGGASSVTVPFVAAAVRAQGVGGGAKISILAAVFMLVFSFLRLGRFASKVPHSVMAGFSCGIGGMMLISQLHTIFGLKSPMDGGASMVSVLFEDLQNIPRLQWTTTLTAALVMVVAAVVARYWPRLPAPLFGILVAVFVSNLVGWSSKEIGILPHTVPPFAGFSWAPADVFSVIPGAVGLAFVTSINLLVTSRVVEHFRGRHAPAKAADADRELGAYALANMAAGMFGAPLSVGIPARSLANVRCGGTTRFSNILHAVFLLIFVTVLGGSISHIPVSALAGVTAWMGISLMGWGTWRRLPKMRRLDAAAFVSTAVGSLAFNAVAAVALGCSFYLVEYALSIWNKPAPAFSRTEAEI